MYLAFNWFTSQILFFYGRAAFCTIWREGTCYLLSKDSFRSSPEFRRQFQHILSRRLLSQNFHSFRGRDPGFFGIRSARPFTVTSLLKTQFFIPIFTDEKGTTSGAKTSANHFAPFFLISISPGHATQWPTFLLRPPNLGLWSVDSLTCILTVSR